MSNEGEENAICLQKSGLFPETMYIESNAVTGSASNTAHHFPSIMLLRRTRRLAYQLLASATSSAGDREAKLASNFTRQFSSFHASTSASGDSFGRDGEHTVHEFPPDRIRTFSIIAHVDHGKSTLSDRLLEFSGAIRKGDHEGQYLDKLQVEKER